MDLFWVSEHWLGQGDGLMMLEENPARPSSQPDPHLCSLPRWSVKARISPRITLDPLSGWLSPYLTSLESLHTLLTYRIKASSPKWSPAFITRMCSSRPSTFIVTSTCGVREKEWGSESNGEGQETAEMTSFIPHAPVWFTDALKQPCVPSWLWLRSHCCETQLFLGRILGESSIIES